MNVDCPHCHKTIPWDKSNPYRPFCSERCKQIDLGAWAEEKYIITSPSPLPDEQIDGD